MDIESIYYSLAPKTKVKTSCLLLIDFTILVKHMTELDKCPNDFGPWPSRLYLPDIRCNQSPFSLLYSNCAGTDWACFWLALTKPSRKISLKYVLLKTWSSLSFFIVF